MPKNKEVKPQGDTAEVAVYTGPTGLADNITSKDLRLPRIALLQSKSPQVENEGDKYRAGMFIDTLTQDILPNPINFVPVFIFKNVIKWKPRTEGGGMLWKTLTPTPEQLAETQFNGAEKPKADMYINAVCMIDGLDTPVLLSFSKTSLKTGQDLVTLATLSGCAWKYKYVLSSIKATKPSGTYYEMRIKRSILNDSPGSSADLYAQVKNMSIDTDYEVSTRETTSETDGDPKEF